MLLREAGRGKRRPSRECATSLSCDLGSVLGVRQAKGHVDAIREASHKQRLVDTDLASLNALAKGWICR